MRFHLIHSVFRILRGQNTHTVNEMSFGAGPISLPGRRIIREAFEELQRTVSPPEAKDFQSTTLEDVQKAAFDIENQLAARKTLRNMRRLMPLFQGLEHYSQSIEVLCNGTPYLPWIWAPIKLILTVLVNK